MRVAILGAGHIANKMARTLKMMKESNHDNYSDITYAIASRDITKSDAMAKEYGFTKAYGSYDSMLEDQNVDLVYVATPHSLHFEHVKRCLEHGKNVLCEKAFMANAKEAEILIKIARDRSLLLAEGAWPRYTPFWAKIKQLLDSEVIGKPQSLYAGMGYNEKDVKRVISPELGGGALLDLGVYAIHFARMCFGGDIENIVSAAHMSKTGVDLQNSITLIYKDGKMAQLHSTTLAVNRRIGIINGENGCMVVDNISNPLSACIYNGKHELIAEYHSEAQLTGFEYEVMACERAMKSGEYEAKELPHGEILEVMRIMDSLRKEWGEVFPSDEMYK